MDHVPLWVSFAQIAANITLALAALGVGVASFIISYRNNFGWPPIILITEIGVGGIGGEHHSFTATLGFEIWNRRKYPLAVRQIRVEIQDLNTHRLPEGNQKPWYYGMKGTITRSETLVIAPTSHQAQRVEIGFTTPSLDAMIAPVKVTAHCFDPRLNKIEIVIANGTYSFHKPEVTA